MRDAVPERALQIAADVGRRCSGWASGVQGAVDRCLSGLASPLMELFFEALKDVANNQLLIIQEHCPAGPG